MRMVHRDPERIDAVLALLTGCASVLVGLTITSLGLAGLPGSARAGSQSFTEDFTTTTFKDPVYTTADWDTVSGELKLLPFVPSLVGAYDTPGSAQGVTVAGGLALVADGSSGLQIVDITDPSAPTLVGTYDTPGFAQGVTVAGDLALLADGSSGLQIVDITDPSSPMLLGTYDTPDYAYGVTVAGDLAFVVDDQSGLQIVDITDPTAPTPVGSYDTPANAVGVTVAGDLAFVADYASGLQIVDITDPSSPTLVGTCDTSGFAQGVTVAGDLALVADGSSGLQIVDITDPSSPTSIGAYDTSGFALGVTVTGDVALVADDVSGLQLVDVTDPSAPTLIGTYDTSGSAYGVAVAGGRLAFVADDASGLRIVNVADTSPVTFVGAHDTPGRAYGVSVAGDLAFVADDTTGLQIVDIADPSSPTLVGTYDTPDLARGVTVAGDLAFVADGNAGLQIVDVTDPSAPTLVGVYDTPGFASNVTAAGDLALVAVGSSGLQIVDITDPSAPTLVGTYSTWQPILGVTVAGDLAFVAAYGNGLQIVDISNPSAPTLVGSHDTPGLAHGVAVAGDLAFVADYESGLQIVDITDPSAPTLVGTYDTPGRAHEVAVAGNLAFVADWDWLSGLQILDITDPSAPTLVGNYDSPDSPYAVTVAGDHAFVADRNSGLRIVEFAQHDWGTTIQNAGRSLVVDGADDAIVRARLTSTQLDGVPWIWELSSDTGENWTPIAPTSTWTRLTDPGSDLVWRSTQEVAGAVNPSVSELTIDWLNAFAPLLSITDVPDDQGRRVELSFTRSGYDFADEVELPVVGYAVYLRVDDEARAAEVVKDGAAPAPAELEGSPLDSYGASRVRALGDDRFVLGGDLARGSAFPPGVWESVAWVLPTQSDQYTRETFTFADSTSAGNHWSVFLTATHTSDPSIWFTSYPDSAYSVDNIPPSIPTGLALVGTELSWDSASESDFEYHSVYGSATAGFDGTAALIGYTVDPTYDVSSESYAFYHVTTTDHAGNEGEAASVEGTLLSSPDASIPTVYALSPPGPNPFRGRAAMTFALPEAGKVRLAIYDASGRAVRTLANGTHGAAVHRVVWDARDDGGRLVGPGVYFARISAGAYEADRRLTVIR